MPDAIRLGPGASRAEPDAIRLGPGASCSNAHNAQVSGRNGTGLDTLQTERLTLRPIRIDDAPLLHTEFGLDEQMHTFTGWNPYATPEAAQAAVTSQVEECDRGDSYCWVAEASGEFVGTVSAYEFDRAQSRIEVGISIKHSAWGNGYATEALARVLEYLTEHEGIRLIVAWVASGNIGSQIAVTRAGMKQTTVEKDALQVESQMFDKIWYEYRSCS